MRTLRHRSRLAGMLNSPMLLSLQELIIVSQGAFNFAQAAMPWLLQHTSKPSGLPPTLIFTGATASLRGSAMLSSFAPAKFATRALAQCLAREYGPRGVHVSHVVIDGMIDIPSSQELMADAGPRAKLDTGAVSVDPKVSESLSRRYAH